MIHPAVIARIKYILNYTYCQSFFFSDEAIHTQPTLRGESGVVPGVRADPSCAIVAQIQQKTPHLSRGFFNLLSYNERVMGIEPT